VLAEEAKGLSVRGKGDEGRGTGMQEDHPSPVPPPSSPFSFLKSMRRVAPESKDWG